MNPKIKKVLLALVLCDFLALTGYVVFTVGYFEAIAAMFNSAVTVLLVFDLLISLTIATVWMWGDARARGVNPMPYLALTLVTGSAGPLLYLVRR